MLDIDVIADPAAAAAALDPIRGRLLAELAEPASAAGLAARLGLPRQKINYHLRALETHPSGPAARRPVRPRSGSRLYSAARHHYDAGDREPEAKGSGPVHRTVPNLVRPGREQR